MLDKCYYSCFRCTSSAWKWGLRSCVTLDGIFYIAEPARESDGVLILCCVGYNNDRFCAQQLRFYIMINLTLYTSAILSMWISKVLDSLIWLNLKRKKKKIDDFLPFRWITSQLGDMAVRACDTSERRKKGFLAVYSLSFFQLARPSHRETLESTVK